MVVTEHHRPLREQQHGPLDRDRNLVERLNPGTAREHAFDLLGREEEMGDILLLLSKRFLPFSEDMIDPKAENEGVREAQLIEERHERRKVALRSREYIADLGVHDVLCGHSFRGNQWRSTYLRRGDQRVLPVLPR